MLWRYLKRLCAVVIVAVVDVRMRGDVGGYVGSRSVAKFGV